MLDTYSGGPIRESSYHELNSVWQYVYMCIGGLSQTYKKYVLTANHVFDYRIHYIYTPLQLILLHRVSVSFLG